VKKPGLAITSSLKPLRRTDLLPATGHGSCCRPGPYGQGIHPRQFSEKYRLKRPQVGLLFVVPGKRETLRAGGTAKIVRDDWLLERMAVAGKKPALATVVTVDRVFFHCAKCVIRSSLWDPQGWPDAQSLSSLAQAVKDHANLSDSVEVVQEGIDGSYRDRLY